MRLLIPVLKVKTCEYKSFLLLVNFTRTTFNDVLFCFLCITLLLFKIKHFWPYFEAPVIHVCLECYVKVDCTVIGYKFEINWILRPLRVTLSIVSSRLPFLFLVFCQCFQFYLQFLNSVLEDLGLISGGHYFYLDFF